MILKKIRDFLFEYDFIWSLPLAFLGFLGYPIAGAILFGDGFGTYSPEIFHSVILTALVVMTFVSLVQVGMYFQVPKVYQFYLGEGFETLPIWLKSIIFLVYYFLLVSVFLIVWLTIV